MFFESRVVSRSEIPLLEEAGESRWAMLLKRGKESGSPGVWESESLGVSKRKKIKPPLFRLLDS